MTRPRRSRRASPFCRDRIVCRVSRRMFAFEVPSTFRVDRGMVVSTDVASWQKPRPEAVPFVASRVSPPQPRTWPNAPAGR